MELLYGLMLLIPVLIIWANLFERKRLRAMTPEQRRKEIQEIRDEGMGGA